MGTVFYQECDICGAKQELSIDECISREKGIYTLLNKTDNSIPFRWTEFEVGKLRLLLCPECRKLADAEYYQIRNIIDSKRHDFEDQTTNEQWSEWLEKTKILRNKK